MYNLNGKIALVTGVGGKNGIGRAIATRLAKEGADVAVNDMTEHPYAADQPDWQGLPDVVREIEGMGQRAISVVADVTDAEQVKGMVEQTVAHFGKIDILVNNAGTIAGKDRVPVVDLAEEDWDRVQRVNVKGVFLCSQAVARHLIAQETGGKIINMSSVTGKRGSARFAAYSASKFAVIGFTQSLASELAPYQVNVNAICPGLVDTERFGHLASVLMPQNLSADEQLSEYTRRSKAAVPIGRLAEGADVAKMAAFLASDEAAYLSGVSITVAGGTVMD
ncbi:3-oxoacyl-ACP reductase FabG [Candidatus Poribacteria bacterium]|nr:3-oxoacyl-ACP reductase FabG [Candidatus Poribacteria bacterium]MXV83904.1 3-oxoacyl-ACP reductase FabG [Candidatus Poribacteria bacterium]MYA58329.1 3-oxoacyl-ACP reductase FabG [Candidatus Poribacteria bacterium]